MLPSDKQAQARLVHAKPAFMRPGSTDITRSMIENALFASASFSHTDKIHWCASPGG